jgi:predicted enzyme related to lactoylglutathione lyase
MARIHDIVFDCHRPAPLARFWAAVLDGYDVAPYDEAEIERLVALGARVLTASGPQPGWIVFGDPEGNEFCLSA